MDGCFWHGCPKHGVQPKGNKEFWLLKLATNKARDRRVDRQLRVKGWRVMRIWEHDLIKTRQHRALRRIVRALLA